MQPLAIAGVPLAEVHRHAPAALPGPGLLRLDLPSGEVVLVLEVEGGCALYLLGGEGAEPTAGLARVLEALALPVGLEDLRGLHPAVVVSRLPVWAVWRQDDNGGTFLVRRLCSQAAAERLVEVLAARGHKQTYWAEAVADPSP